MVTSDDDDDGSVLVQLQESMSEADSVSDYMSHCTLLVDTVAKPWGDLGGFKPPTFLQGYSCDLHRIDEKNFAVGGGVPGVVPC